MTRPPACHLKNDPEHSRRLLWHAAGALNDEEARELEAHLGVCADCREQARFATSLGESLRRLFRAKTEPEA